MAKVDFKTNVEDITILQERVAESIETGLKHTAAVFFKNTPEIRAVHWVQYTPYFNDGEPCEFYAHTPDHELDRTKATDYDGEEIEEEYEGDSLYDPAGFYASYKSSVVDKQAVEYPNATEIYHNFREFSNVIEAITDEMKLAIWGDHVRIVITRDGIKKIDYEHE